MSFRSIAVAALMATANAHIIMESPIPFSVDKIDNAPITKSQFPCKSNLGFTVSQMNAMAVGEEQTIKFKGTAVHGGGSCQLSVTMDTEPTEASVFKVIKSIEGGCPGVDGSTNSYQFSLPDSVPNGKATFAWTWFSKMSGAPELYMNCAPIEVTGGASDSSKFDALPDMLVANIGDGCTSAQNFATKYPNPGQDVQEGATNDQEPPKGSCGASGASPPTEGAPSAAPGAPSAAPSAAPGSPSAAPSAAPGAPSAVPTPPAGGAPSVAPTPPAGQYTEAPKPTAAPPAASPTASAPGGEFAPGAGASTKTTLVTVTGAPKPTAPLGTGVAPTPAKPTSAPAPGAPAPGAPAAPGGSTCTTEGAIMCQGETKFGLCNHGQVVWQDVAAGTKCTNGVIARRGYNGRIARPRHMHKH